VQLRLHSGRQLTLTLPVQLGTGYLSAELLDLSSELFDAATGSALGTDDVGDGVDRLRELGAGVLDLSLDLSGVLRHGLAASFGTGANEYARPLLSF
jgi:hypothetical protein